MLKEVNIDVLIELKITAHQFMILWMVLNERYRSLEKYLKETNSYDTFKDDLDQLAELPLISYNKEKPYDYKSIVAKPDFLRSLVKDDIFEEFYNEFPKKVNRPDGILQYLRRDKRLCEDLYYIITKDDLHKHRHIMDCLAFELKHRKSSGSMQWFKTMQKWLSTHEWENYEDIVDDDPQQQPTKEAYGTQLE